MSLQVNIKKRLGSFTLESAFAMDGGVLGVAGGFRLRQKHDPEVYRGH